MYDSPQVLLTMISFNERTNYNLVGRSLYILVMYLGKIKNEKDTERFISFFDESERFIYLNYRVSSQFV